MFCPNCGANITNGAKFCPKCGAQLNDSKEQQTNSGSEGKPVQKKHTVRTIIIIVVAVIILAFWLLPTVLSQVQVVNRYDISTVTPSQSVSTETVIDDTTTEEVTEKKDEEVTEEPEEETNPEIENLKATLLDEKASLPEPDGRQIKKASKYRIDGSLASETEYYENGVIADVIEYDMDGYKDTETKYNESGEIIEEHNYSTKDHIYYEYGEFGVISKTDYGKEGNGTNFSDDMKKTLINDKTDKSYTVLMTEREFYSYDERGNLTQINYESCPAGTKPQDDGRDVYVYDKNNNLLEYYKDIILDPENVSPTWEFTYDENNNMTSAKIRGHTISSDSNLKYSPYYTYTYDNNNNLVIKQKYDLSDLSLQEWEEYIYDDDNILIEDNVYDSTDNLMSSRKYTYSFDKEGRELSASWGSELRYWDNGNLLLSYNGSYKPNCNYIDAYNNKFEESYTVYWDNGNIAIEGTTEKDSPTNKYDYFGNVTYEFNDTFHYENIYTYTYDGSGNVLTETIVTVNSRSGTSEERTDYTYENEYYD